MESQTTAVLLALDEIDYLQSIAVFEEFMSVLRTILNSRAFSSAFARLSILLASAIHPSSFITNQLQSPFNLGFILSPANFSLSETKRLLGVELSDTETYTLFRFTGGQPFLTHVCAYLLNARFDVATIKETALDLTSPFQMHLDSLYAWVNAESWRRQAIARFIDENTISPKDRGDFLLSGIIVRGSAENSHAFACELYERFFRSRLG